MTVLTVPPVVVALAGRRELLGRVARFATIGVLSTGAYLALYLLLRPFGAQLANATALLLTAMANTAANRWFTFGVRGSGGAGRQQLQGLLVYATGLAVTSGALAACHALLGTSHPAVDLAVLVAANLAATVIRFVALSNWVFPDARPAGDLASHGDHCRSPDS